jgi:hypothetical protein
MIEININFTKFYLFSNRQFIQGFDLKKAKNKK